MKENEILSNIHQLESRYGNYRSKCLRNMRLFTYSSTTTLDISESEVVGFYQRGTFSVDDDTSSAIQENVIASCIETLCSKIASQKVRPFFNTVNGTFKEMQIAKQAQVFFDMLYEENNVNIDERKCSCEENNESNDIEKNNTNDDHEDEDHENVEEQIEPIIIEEVLDEPIDAPNNNEDMIREKSMINVVKEPKKDNILVEEGYSIFATFYRVHEGDTYSSISLKHNCNEQKLMLLNNNMELKEGLLIRIPK